MNVIETKNITFKYPDGTKALDNVDFTAADGNRSPPWFKWCWKFNIILALQRNSPTPCWKCGNRERFCKLR